jgi:hypothetical protein
VSWLALVPSSESGLASRMAHLEGLRGIPPVRHLELLPYASVREEYIAPPRPGNPFNDGSRPFGGAGLDLKYAVTQGLVADLTVNTDWLGVGHVDEVVSPAPDGGTMSFAVASGVEPAIARVVGAEVLKRCTFRGSVSEGWNAEVPEPWALASVTIERWTNAVASDASARAGC